MDNLSSHKGPRVQALIEVTSAIILNIPPYRRDFYPIENALAKLMALLRKTAARTQDALWDAIGKRVDHITPAECANMLAVEGYDPC